MQASGAASIKAMRIQDRTVYLEYFSLSIRYRATKITLLSSRVRLPMRSWELQGLRSSDRIDISLTYGTIDASKH